MYFGLVHATLALLCQACWLLSKTWRLDLGGVVVHCSGWFAQLIPILIVAVENVPGYLNIALV